MTFLFVIAIVGGAASVLTPCVLPLLPAILAVSGGEGRRRVWGIVAGIEVSFFLIALLLAGAISSLGLPKEFLRFVAAASLAVSGVVLVVGKLHGAFTVAASRLTSRLPAGAVAGAGFGPGFASGLPLGLVWAPCAGPILAGITVAASTSRLSTQTFVTMSGYALGMIGPLAAVIFGGQRLSLRLRRALGGGRRVLVPMGVVLLATAVLVGLGGLNRVNQLIAENVNLTSTPTSALERRALEVGRRQEATTRALVRAQVRSDGAGEGERLEDLGPAPQLTGISHWFNTDGRALTLRRLRGSVVLLDFWTYSCINCLRTLPYLKAWDRRYREDGLVILGVHSPEFEFESDAGNVGRAVNDLGIRYPVALDPDLATWRNFSNRYWPAHYLIDRDGRLRSIHFGEGAYARTENHIRRLIGMAPTAAGHDPILDDTTPETYLGYRRAERFEGRIGGGATLVADSRAVYEPPRGARGDVRLNPDSWAYAGSWTVGREAAVAGKNAHIYLHFRARRVFIVAGRPAGRRSGTIRAALAKGAKDAVVDRDRLYTVRSGARADHLIRLDVSPGVAVYSFTFG